MKCDLQEVLGGRVLLESALTEIRNQRAPKIAIGPDRHGRRAVIQGTPCKREIQRHPKCHECCETPSPWCDFGVTDPL